MISEGVLLAAIYIPLIGLLGVTLFRMISVTQLLRERKWQRSLSLVSGVIVILAVLLLEQIWYGIGRFFPSVYQQMTNTALVVGMFKLGYVSALLLWTKAFFELTGDPPAWRCAMIFAAIAFATGVFLALGVI